MQRYRRAVAVLIGVAAFVVTLVGAGAQTPETPRIAFQIATGPVGGSYFPVGEALARIISYPPGFGRCEDDPNACGPVGLIASARSTDGPVANITAVRSGRVDSALVQADIATLAYRGAGPFRAAGAFKDLRVLAKLQTETVHLVVSARARVRRITDLKHKRVAIDDPSSTTNLTARSILTAARVNPRRVKLSYQGPAQAAADLKAGKIDAFFIIGASPVRLVDDLVKSGTAKLLPIDGRSLAAWLKKQEFLSPVDLPAGTYHGTKPVRTVSVSALWVATSQLPDKVAYSLARALWNPANRREFDNLGPVGASIHRDGALVSSIVPLHPGAAKFYQDAGRLQN
ncbi:MAG: TAXI family TRAP transporter solute-binding subunit [Alphaproteobacteria bacterium]|nr:TAXI family TRAP transporter solute-binding subunit [Alphaproteobacteria bacterium]